MISSIRTVTTDMRAVVDNHHAHGSYVLKRCTRPVYTPSALYVHWYTLNFGLDPWYITKHIKNIATAHMDEPPRSCKLTACRQCTMPSSVTALGRMKLQTLNEPCVNWAISLCAFSTKKWYKSIVPWLHWGWYDCVVVAQPQQIWHRAVPQQGTKVSRIVQCST